MAVMGFRHIDDAERSLIRVVRPKSWQGLAWESEYKLLVSLAATTLMAAESKRRERRRFRRWLKHWKKKRKS